MLPAMYEQFSGAWALIESGAQALIDRFGEDAYLEARLRSHESPKQLLATTFRGIERRSRTRLEGESGTATRTAKIAAKRYRPRRLS
jgi:hypothetical protein